MKNTTPVLVAISRITESPPVTVSTPLGAIIVPEVSLGEVLFFEHLMLPMVSV